jgi:thiol-disulfide isomerase/thioredoxin
VVRGHLTGSRFAAVVAVLLASATGSAAPSPAAAIAPEFSHTATADWINSAPLTLAGLRGKVVLVEFWTFDCINCLRSGAWLKKTAADKAAAGLVVVGVHTPELPQEKLPDNVRAAVRRLGIRYPVMIDLDYAYWHAMHNQYWPAFYLIDRDGRLRGSTYGELHVGETRALQVERALDQLLAAR